MSRAINQQRRSCQDTPCTPLQLLSSLRLFSVHPCHELAERRQLGLAMTKGAQTLRVHPASKVANSVCAIAAEALSLFDASGKQDFVGSELRVETIGSVDALPIKSGSC